MIYSFAINTPANTSEANKKKTDLKLTSGVIHQLDIVFPSGCNGLAYIAINNGLHQIWPTNPGERFHTDGETITFKEFYQVKENPLVLSVYTFNLDDTHDHAIVVRLGLLKRTDIQGVWLPWSEEVIGK